MRKWSGRVAAILEHFAPPRSGRFAVTSVLADARGSGRLASAIAIAGSLLVRCSEEGAAAIASSALVLDRCSGKGAAAIASSALVLDRCSGKGAAAIASSASVLDRRSAKASTAAVIVLSASLLAGCSATGTARSARVASPGSLGFNGAMLNLTYAPGLVELERDDGSRVSTRRNTGAALPAISPLLFLGDYELGLRVGVGGGCEVGALLGWTRVGPEARCQLLDEVAAPLSMAGSVAGGWSFFGQGPWVRGGVDVSRQFAALVPLTNLYVSYGGQGHSVLTEDLLAPDARSPGHFPDFSIFRRRELRVSAALGVLLGARENSDSVGPYLAIEPYYTLWSSPIEGACESCKLRPIHLDERFGFTVMLGLERLPLGDAR